MTTLNPKGFYKGFQLVSQRFGSRNKLQRVDCMTGSEVGRVSRHRVVRESLMSQMVGSERKEVCRSATSWVLATAINRSIVTSVAAGTDVSHAKVAVHTCRRVERYVHVTLGVSFAPTVDTGTCTWDMCQGS